MNVTAIFLKTYLREITVLATAVVLVSVLTLAFVENQPTLDDGILNAAIIDQLYDGIPNTDFQQNATEYFKTAGYDVDIYNTKDVTVDFYKKLPSMGYEFIVIRSHATGLFLKFDSGTLFTGEKYSTKKHSADQLSGHLGKAAPFRDSQLKNMSQAIVANQTYFVIGSNFVEEKMVGKFPGSVIVLAGCATARSEFLSQSLLDRGASVVVGWTDNVLSRQNDKVILSFLEKMLVDGEVVPEAVSSVTNEFSLYLEPEGLRYFT